MQRLKGKRDRALLAKLLACGLRRHEAAALRLDQLEQREEPIGSLQPQLIEESCSAGSTKSEGHEEMA
jgi:hypothetical protein